MSEPYIHCPRCDHANERPEEPGEIACEICGKEFEAEPTKAEPQGEGAR